jgi:hypothetical protein
MNKILLLGIALACGFLFTTSAHAQWSAPTGAPPTNNVASPLNLSSTAQTKLGGLILNTGGAQYGLLIPLGAVGIGTLTPASALSVNGGVQVGDDSSGCNATKAGTIRWNSGSLQICSGTAWTAFSSSSSGPALGSVNGYCRYRFTTSFSWGSGWTYKYFCDSTDAPAWCSPTTNCGCGTGYTLTFKNQTKSGGCWFSWADCDTSNEYVCVRNSTPIPASCSASGPCAAGPDGAKCSSYTTGWVNSSNQQCAGGMESTCTNGVWSPTPGYYGQCQVYGCNDQGACNYHQGGNSCTYPDDNGDCP